jgi:hypothetical protein
MVVHRIASGRDRVRKAKRDPSEIRSRAKLSCALPLFLHPAHQRDTAHRPIGTGRLCARRRFGYWREQIGHLRDQSGHHLGARRQEYKHASRLLSLRNCVGFEGVTDIGCYRAEPLGRVCPLADLMRGLDGPISSLFVGVGRKRRASCLGGDGSGRAGHFRERSQIEVFEGPGAWRRLLLKARGRVLETKTARTF